MKIFTISDIHGEMKHITDASDLISDADCVVISGDLARTGSRAEAEEVLASIQSLNSSILAVHGNWDRIEVLDLLEEKGYSIHGCGRIINDIGFFGAGGSSPTPMHTATEYPEEEIYALLQKGFNEVKEALYRVMVSHTPPYGVRDRTFLGLHGGSRSVEKFLKEEKINMCLTGHIHEAHGRGSLNSCVVVNSGAFKKGRYSFIETGEVPDITLGRIR